MENSQVAIAGITGFIGRALADFLLTQGVPVVGLTRGNFPEGCTVNPGSPCPIEWRRCDLYSPQHCVRSLAGVHTAFYLVHSMLPSARLNQGRFENTDLLMADNFARGARANGVKHIIYLGGFIPSQDDLSRHLRSRLEVEEALRTCGVPVTALRAGIVLGSGGASLKMLLEVVRKLPVLPCPKESHSLTQPVALADLLEVLTAALKNPTETSRTFDVAGREILSYRQLLRETAAVLGLQRNVLSLPHMPIPMLAHITAQASGVPAELTGPLIESLKLDMIASQTPLPASFPQPQMPLRQAIHQATIEPSAISKHRCCLPQQNWKRKFFRKDVRAVHRLPLPPGKDVAWLAGEYAKFHPSIFKFTLGAEFTPSGRLTIYWRWPKIVLLSMQVSRSQTDADQILFRILGGALARHARGNESQTKSRFEFRRVPSGTGALAAIHDYTPALPWPIYLCTQAMIHLYFIRKFKIHIQKIIAREASRPY